MQNNEKTSSPPRSQFSFVLLIIMIIFTIGVGLLLGFRLKRQVLSVSSCISHGA